MLRRPRAALSAVLLVLACLLVPVGTVSTWAKYEIEDADAYVATMAPLASDPAVRDAVTAAVTDSVAKEIDAGPLQSTVESFLHDAVRSFTETSAFRTAWNAANRAAHDAVQSALTHDSDGAVTIDLAPITEQVKRQLTEEGTPFASRIPVRHTEVTVMQAQDLSHFRKGFRMLQVAGLWLPVAAVLLAAGGILLAVRRRRAVTATALGAAVGAATLAAAIAVARGLTLADLPPDVSRTAAGAVYDALTDTLRTASWVIVGVGLAVAAGAWVSGRTGWAGGGGAAGGGGGGGESSGAAVGEGVSGDGVSGPVGGGSASGGAGVAGGSGAPRPADSVPLRNPSAARPRP
ncbi:hypothetical protein [Streptomyces flavofungini]|uniref:hypothetical protein n=1 Tax=Streptomyces flavofungini TaxID=68200 RepID=UPI0025B239CC|nr:hypothetical protein [Streptomyces flavofungini]WJV47373.1 hypothetical protein QUY26_18710 [Streptomyces flavofungini]